MKTILRRLAAFASVILAAGQHVVYRRRIAEDRLRRASAASLSILGSQQLVAVDVGAANGVLPHWTSLDGVATIYQIEPRADASAELRKNNAAGRWAEKYHVIETGLSEHGGSGTLYVSNAPTGSSLLKIDPEGSPDFKDYIDLTYLYPIVEQSIETETLAAVMDRQNQPQLDLIKLDVQGAELPILRGLDGRRLDSLLGVELEIGLHDLYPEAAGLEPVTAFMDSHGLELFDLRVARVQRPAQADHAHYQRKVFSVHANSPTVSARVCELDAVFFRRKSAILQSRDAGLIRRMVLVYCTYNFFSEAYSLIEKASEQDIVTATEVTELKQKIVELHHSRHHQVWLDDTAEMEWLRRTMYRISPRSAPRWCQYMYQDYPQG